MGKTAKRPKYQEIYTYYRGLIRAGLLRRGDRIPPEHSIERDFSVSRITVSGALRMLQMVLTEIIPDIKRLVDQYTDEFIMGRRPLSEWDNRIATLGKMRLGDLERIYKVAYGRFTSL